MAPGTTSPTNSTKDSAKRFTTARPSKQPPLLVGRTRGMVQGCGGITAAGPFVMKRNIGQRVARKTYKGERPCGDTGQDLYEDCCCRRACLCQACLCQACFYPAS